MAMVYALWKNFHSLQDPHGMQQILFWGSIFIVALLLFAPLMASVWPAYVLPFVYPIAAWVLAERHQMTKQAIASSQDYEFQTVLNVIAASIVFLIAMMVTALIWINLLVAFGLFSADV